MAILRAIKSQARQDDLVDSSGYVFPVCSEEEVGIEYYDNNTCKKLITHKVQKARQEEMEEFRRHQVYVKVPVVQAYKETGKAPIPVGWLDINKGDEGEPEYRSRLVAKDVKRTVDEDLFAATPPLEANRHCSPSRSPAQRKAPTP